MKSIAIIPARGGSKRIPKKNIKNFCGKPIIAYSIAAAKESGLFDEVMVSTDSEEIAQIARAYGANVPFLRSEATSNDYATTADVIAEVLDAYAADGKTFDYFACVYATAPFLTGEKLATAMHLLQKNRAAAVVSVVKYGFPPQRAFIIKDAYLQYQYPEFQQARSQDLEPIYHDAGQLYIWSCAAFKDRHSLIVPKTVPFIMVEEEVQDIDTMADWVIAEAKFQAMH